MTFGELIVRARKRANLTQKDLAARVTKEDGESISPTYLHDIENDRRNPPAGLIEAFAAALDIPADLLYFHAGLLPPDIRNSAADEKKVLSAFEAFRRVIRK